MNINILTDAETEQLREVLASAVNIVVCCHKSPDGDAVGSSLAWAQYLTAMDKEVTVVLPDAAPDFLHWMPGFDKVLRYDKKPEEVAQAFDKAHLVCCLDFNASSRTEALQSVLDACQSPKLLIDHHLSPEIDAVMTISRPDACSTSEMVFSLIWQLSGETIEAFTTDMARCIYCGMMTDTGGFTYNSQRPEIYFIISQLLLLGVDKDNIFKKVYHTLSQNCLRLRAYVISRKMRVVKGLNAAYFTITRQEMKRSHFQRGDAEGLVNEPLRIKGMKLSISLREDTEKDNLVLVSLRSSCGFHCEQMAREFFNGGGHENAAGGRLFCSMDDAEQITLKAILAYSEQLK